MSPTARSASGLNFENDPVPYRCFPWRASARTSSHAWKPVACRTASRRSSVSKRSSIFSLSAASTTKLFRSRSRLQTASRALIRGAGSLTANVRVFTVDNLAAQSCAISDSQCIANSTILELVLRRSTSKDVDISLEATRNPEARHRSGPPWIARPVLLNFYPCSILSTDVLGSLRGYPSYGPIEVTPSGPSAWMPR